MLHSVSDMDNDEPVLEPAQGVFRSLFEFASQVSRADTCDQAIEVFLQFAIEISQANLAVVYLRGAAGQLSPGIGRDQAGASLGKVQPPDWLGGGDLLSHAASSPILTGEAAGDAHPIPGALQARGAVSGGIFPLLSGTHPVGVLCLYYPTIHHFLATEGQILALAASRAGEVVERFNLLDQNRQVRLATETLRQALAAFSATLDLEQVLSVILEQLQQVIRYDSAALMLLEADQVQVRAVRGHPYPEMAMQINFPLRENSLARAIIDQQATLILADAQREPRFERLGRTDYVRGWMGVPLIVRGRTIGLLTLDSRQLNAYTSEDAELALAFAGQAAIAVENARLYQSQREQHTLSQVMREISLVLSSSLETNAILEAILRQIERVIPSDSSCVLLLEEGHLRVTAERGYEQFGVVEQVKDFNFRLEEVPNLMRMSFTLQPHYISDVRTCANWIEAASSRHVGSWLGAPLVAQNRLMGFLSLDKVERGYYQPEHATRLEMLASHAALALSNALAYGEVERAAITDFVTATYNHRYFHQQLRLEVERARRFGSPVSLLMIDLDFFKVVNDTYGHQFGDRVLHQLAARLSGTLRVVDTLARYGGEEFAVILPGTGPYAAFLAAERLRGVIISAPFVVDDQPVAITVSVGIASFPNHAKDTRELVAGADQALYQAKQGGRDQVRGGQVP